MTNASKLKILAVIQARGGSKGIPKKNIYPVAGHPLIAYTIAAALETKMITDLVVSTDCEEIAEISVKYGAEVPFMRPADLAGDKVKSVDSLYHAVRETERIKEVEYDYVVELPCVSPLRNSEDIEGALHKLIDSGADSVISVACTGEKHPIRLKKISDDRILDFTEEYPEPEGGSRRQELKPDAYIRNGAIYSMTRNCLIDGFSRHGDDSRPYIMPPDRSINIDERLDLQFGEFLIEGGKCANRPKLTSQPIKISLTDQRPKILITAPFHFLPEARKTAETAGDCIFAPDADVDSLRRLLSGVDAWLCSPCPTYLIDSNILEHAPKLKIISTPSTGSNHIDKDWCAANDIAVTTLRNTDFVNQIYASSEFTFLLILALVRKLPKACDLAKAGFWRDKEDLLRGREIRGLTLGVIGYGRIGQNISRYAKSFGMEVFAFDPHKNINSMSVRQTDTAFDVLKQSDIVAICVHLDHDTINMVDETWFLAMKDGSYFVNSSRGEVVKEDALLNALRSEKLGGAAVDVICDEFLSDKSEHPLVRFAAENDKLIITPHIAGLTFESEGKAADYAIRAICETLA